MRERPILFSAPMIRAILGGRKSQTRRIYKPRSVDNVEDPNGALYALPTPYGSPGDRLWVREAILCTSLNKRPPPYDDDRATAVYAADGAPCPLDRWPWQRFRLPSIHMPHGLRRITLEVTEVRVQRLQEINEDDSRAEGCQGITGGPDLITPREEFECLWRAINGARATWASNPWVWAITFAVAT